MSTKRHDLAGLALRNGVLVIGPKYWACAIRNRDGTLDVTTKPRPQIGTQATDKLPFLRGPIRLLGMAWLLPSLRHAMPNARFGFESRQVIIASVVGSILMRRVRRARGEGALTELVGAVASLATTVVTLRGGETAQYHGAEHKAIAGYEQEIPAREAAKEHPRCGTQLALPMLIGTAMATQGALLLSPNNPQLARTIGSGVGMALATEFARLSRTNDLGGIARAMRHAGIALQAHATTAEPTDDQLEVAETALQAVLKAEAAAA